jgi:hypothetical protein
MYAIMERPAALRGAEPARSANQQERQTALTQEMRWNALLWQQDLLGEEIKRGKECLERAQTQLAESRSQLEEWPAYERRCGENYLPGLTESVSVNKRIERFLTGWLKRRQGQLVAVNQAIDLFNRTNDFGPPR